MKRLVEDFDDMMNIEDEVSVEDTKSPLEKELIRVYEYLKDKGETDIKAYEVAYQEAIENIYPETSWWEVIDLNIFWDLFENQNPRTTIDNIISSIKPEFKKEVIDTVVTEDIEEENPLKDIRSNIIEFPNGEYAYVEYADGKLYAGGATNRGIIHEYEMDYDKDYDVDRNLQNFFDKIIEENPELGEPLDESKKDKVCERATRVKRGSLIETKYSDYLDSELYSRIANDAWHKREVKSFDNDFDTVIAFLHTLPSAELVDLAVDTGIYDFSMPDSFDAMHRDEYLKDRLAGLTEDDFEEIAERIDDTVLDALGFHSWYRKNVGKVTRLRERAGLAESKKVCEDTVKQGNKWVNKGKDGTHGTFRTKKAADAQRKAMFANKGKKSTFGESFKVGDALAKGKTWKEFISNLESQNDIKVDSAYKVKYDNFIEFYSDGELFEGEVTKYRDGGYELLRENVRKVRASKVMSAVQGGIDQVDEARSLNVKESDDDFVVFEQEPDDAYIDTDWFFDEVDYYIDGGRYFNSINKDFLDKEVNNEAIHKVFNDIDEDDEFYIVKDIFDYFDGDDITSALSAGLGEDYEDATLRGVVQREWVTIYYPKRKYSRDDISIIEDYYFGKFTAWYNEDYGEIVITDTDLGFGYDNSAKVKKIISDTIGVPVDQIKLRRFKGYHQVADYIDESKQRRRSNRCVTEAKKEKLDKSTKQNVKVFDELFNGLSHWNNNFSAYASTDESANKKNIQKLFKKVDSMISDATTFANRFKVVYKSLLAAGITLDKSPSTIKRLSSNLSQKYMKMSEKWRDDKSDRAKNGNLADVYYAYAAAFEDLSDFVDEVNAEINKDIKEKLSKRTKAKRIYESMKRKPKKNLKEAYDDDLVFIDNRKSSIINNDPSLDPGFDEYDVSDFTERKRKPKKNLKEAADDEIKLFMNTWANYNENGADDGITPTGWMSLDEAEEYAEKYAEYEPFINDTENVPIEFDVDEYSNIPETVDMLRKYEDFDDTQREVFAAFIDDGYEVDEAFRIVDGRDYIYYEADSDADLAYNYIDEIGGVENLGRDTLERYFDYDGFGRDLAYDFIKTENGYVSR